jgi:Ser/Thr protein kinase RdoA (MazF antagonist)
MTDHERVAGDVFGVHGVSTTLPGDTDHNTKIVCTDGRNRLLRISPVDQDLGELEFRQGVLAVAADFHLQTPAVVPTIDGKNWAILADGRVAHMYTWVEGLPLSEARYSSQLAYETGTVAGAMVEILSGLQGGPRASGFLWDLTDADGVIRDRMTAIGDVRRRDVINRVLQRCERIAWSDLARQVIHNDLNRENLLVQDGSIVGVIDFGDAIETARIAELAIACTYVMLGQDDPMSAATEAIAGFRSIAPLDIAEADALFDLILTRLATSVAISTSRGDANPHHVVSQEAAWQLLEWLMAGDADGLATELAIAGASIQGSTSVGDGLPDD